MVNKIDNWKKVRDSSEIEVWNHSIYLLSLEKMDDGYAVSLVDDRENEIYYEVFWDKQRARNKIAYLKNKYYEGFYCPSKERRMFKK